MGQPLQDARCSDHVKCVTTWQIIGITQGKRQARHTAMRPTRLCEQPSMDVEPYRQTIWGHCLGYAPGHGPGPTSHIEHDETRAQELRSRRCA